MEIRIFYSWQSDLHSSTNRQFIKEALVKAIKNIDQDHEVEVSPRIDHDTLGVAGSPDIADTIFEKIRQSSVFVCDVSIINKTSKFRKTPNPNVLIELGYAMNVLGQDRIIMAFNKAYGNEQDLPFDLQRLRLLSYNLPPNANNKSEIKKDLERRLEYALRLIVEKVENEPKTELIKGADLSFKVKSILSEISMRGKHWDTHKIHLQIRSINNISSQDGAAKIRIANPMLFSQSPMNNFNVTVSQVGYFSDNRNENPHAQEIRLSWNANNNGTIFPGEWFNFHNNYISVDIPNNLTVQKPTFLFHIELLTIDSPVKSYSLYIQRSETSGSLEFKELTNTNQEEIMSLFWETYWNSREVFQRENTPEAKNIYKENMWRNLR